MNNDELIYKKQYNFCISLFSQLIEEIEFESNANIIKNNNHRKILFSIFSLLKYQIKIFQDLFSLQNKQLHNITQFQELRNIFYNGKGYIKKIINEILSYSKSSKIKGVSKNILSNNIISKRNYHNDNISNNNTLNDANTYVKKTNHYMFKIKRNIKNDNIRNTVSKSIDIINNNNSNYNSNSNSILSSQAKFKKNICNVKQNQNKSYNNINNKSKTKILSKKNKYKKFIINAADNKNNDTHFNREDTKSSLSINSIKNLKHQKIIVNQVNINNKHTKTNTNTNRNYNTTNTNPPFTYVEENPVRKVKNIIKNAKSLSTLNIGIISHNLHSHKRAHKEVLKNSNSTYSLSKDKTSNINRPYTDFYEENKNYGININGTSQTCQNSTVKKDVSKDRKCNEILIDGMNSIKKKLNSIENYKKIKKSKSISNLKYIKEIFEKKQ